MSLSNAPDLMEAEEAEAYLIAVSDATKTGETETGVYPAVGTYPASREPESDKV